jgi:ABC-type dipeptide/oligopeptide/nickel transport system permease subunit
MLAALVAMFLNIVAGWYGGIDRRVGAISNVMLLSPSAYLLLGNLIGIFLLGIG